jgi:glycosyltransferase involved in cell wall biosynthesis
MGTSAISYFKSNGVDANFEIIPGGFSVHEFYSAKNKKEYDLILIGRLSEVKQVDVFLKAILHSKRELGNIQAVIVGDGPDRRKLEDMSKELELINNVEFVGWQNNIGDWLRKSKIFLLTSSSEGLSQALIQAMMCGVPAIVSDVGDLNDLVDNGVNGYLIKNIQPSEFSKKIVKLLNDKHLLDTMSEKALLTSESYQTGNVSKQWDVFFNKYFGTYD